MSTPSSTPRDPKTLVSLLSLDEAAAPAWNPADFAPMFQHQLRAPLVFDLEDVAGARHRSVQELTMAPGGPAMQSFADVLFAPRPPVELLELIKAFAKAVGDDRQAPLPREVATVLYHLAIAAALARAGARITSLPDARLRDGLAWARGQAFVDERSRAVLEEAMGRLAGA